MVANVYKVDGKRVPGVTTIIGKYGEKEGLLHWANQQGLDGKNMEEARDKAADSGTLAHEMVDRWIKHHLATRAFEAKYSREELEDAINALKPGPNMIVSEWMALAAMDRPEDVTDPRADVLGGALKGFEAFETWMESANVELDASEIMLTSKAHKYGGQIDGRGRVGKKKKRALLDWKTSNRVYPEYIMQLGGYAILWDEAWPDEPIEEVHLLRFSKEFGAFTWHYFPVEILEAGKEAFLHLRRMHDLHALMKKAVG